MYEKSFLARARKDRAAHTFFTCSDGSPRFKRRRFAFRFVCIAGALERAERFSVFHAAFCRFRAFRVRHRSDIFKCVLRIGKFFAFFVERFFLRGDRFRQFVDVAFYRERFFPRYFALSDDANEIFKTFSAFRKKSFGFFVRRLLQLLLLLPVFELFCVENVLPFREFFFFPTAVLQESIGFGVLCRKSRDKSGNIGGISRDILSRFFDDGRRETAFLRDVEGAAFARNAHEYAVSRREGFPVELGRRVDAAFVRPSVIFEYTLMRRHERKGFFFNKRVENRHADRSTFLRIGTASEFVEEDEAFFAAFGDRARDVFHVRAERRKRRVDRLSVAYVGKHFIEDRKARTFRCGNRKAALVQKRKERYRFERNRFAAGVRPRDY